MLNSATVENRHTAEAVGLEDGAQVEMLGIVLDDACSYLADLNQFLSATSNLFRLGDTQTANGSFAELISGLELLLQTIDIVVPALGLGFKETLPGGECIEGNVGELQGILTETMRAQERKDWVLLSDLLDYELAPHLDHWKLLFASLRPATP